MLHYITLRSYDMLTSCTLTWQFVWIFLISVVFFTILMIHVTCFKSCQFCYFMSVINYISHEFFILRSCNSRLYCVWCYDVVLLRYKSCCITLRAYAILTSDWCYGKLYILTWFWIDKSQFRVFTYISSKYHC